MSRQLYLLTIVLCILGFFVSLHLFALKYQVAPAICGITSCEEVNSSSYSYLFGIPNSLFGMGFYAAVAALLISKRKKLVFWLTFFGFVFSIYLTAIEAFVIKAYCQWCLLSAWVSVCLFAIAYISKGRKCTQDNN